MEIEPTIQEEDESESARPHPPETTHAPVTTETAKECATRLRRVVQSGEYREQYRRLKRVVPHSGHSCARYIVT